MTFKEQATADVAAVFFNTDEFCDIHNVNGTDMTVQIDSNELQKQTAGKVYTAEAAGLYKGSWLIYVSSLEYGSLPAIGSIITLDSKKRRVIDAKNEAGVYSIELEAIRS
ncbi:MAG: hypothetical protein CVU91_07400 [Firmicutes bacterium HGW-Firmicutes-16]|nr:MAG: hypothetical protein CVU91_07400 [Firmicutes bacterium HGW-Firmicutes-16]